MNNLVRVTRVLDPAQVYGVIEWSSHAYPHKRYVAQCFSGEMYFNVWCLVEAIRDYHTIVRHAHLKH